MSTAITDFTPQYPALMDPDRMRNSIRRLFSNNWNEIFGELLQNSQRAGATRVDVRVEGNRVTVADNGHGLLGGVAGFEKLLALAVSEYESERAMAQDPMGLGVHALLASKYVTEVTFESHGFGIRIDTQKWWADADYYRTWYKQVYEIGYQHKGVILSFTTSEEEAERVRAMLLERAPKSEKDWYYHRPTNPARGYGDILTVTCDGEPVKATDPRSAVAKDPLLTFEYQGNRVEVGLFAEDSSYANNVAHGLVVNWYGQIIEDLQFSTFFVTLRVREGRPVNPKAPVRTGLIEDDARKALQQEIEDRVFALLATPGKHITVLFLEKLSRLNRERYLKESPYWVVRRLLSSKDPDYYYNRDIYKSPTQHGENEIVARGEELVFAKAGVTIVEVYEDGTSEEYTKDWGETTFLEMLDEPVYDLVLGNNEGIKPKFFIWRPGAVEREGNYKGDMFRGAGEWALAAAGEEPEWRPVTTSVMAFTEMGCEIDGYDLIVYAPDKVKWLQGSEVTMCFSPGDDEDYEPQEEAWEDSINSICRLLLANAVPRISTYAITQMFENTHAGLRQIVFLDDDSGADIEVTSKTGEVKRLRFFG